ncbi:MAG: SIMPL domain-containing protein [Methanobacteriota archaeon]
MQIMHKMPILVLILCLVAGVAALADDTTKLTPEKNLIHVSGSGVVKTAPDRCEISFSVVTKNSDVKAAQKENARKMDTVMGALKDPSKGNLTPAEIGTSSYSISEMYSPDDALKAKFGENVVIYEVSNTITIETDRIDLVGDFIDIAVASGANGVSSLQFTLSKARTTEFRTQALKIAVDKAKADAEAVASALGQQVGPVREVTVDDTYSPPLYYNQDMKTASYAAAAPSTPIQPGSIDVTAKVSIAYEII